MRKQNCYSCKFFKDKYCEVLELHPCYTTIGCNDYFENDETHVTAQYEDIVKAFQLGLTFGFGEKHDEMDKIIEEIKKVITPVIPNCYWIPVSERLPEENKSVIVSAKYGVYPEARYTKENGWEWAYEAGADYWSDLEDVTAWMPLPEPYKTESEVKE